MTGGRTGKKIGYMCIYIFNIFGFASGSIKDQQEVCSNIIDKIVKFSVLLRLTESSQYMVTSTSTPTLLLHHFQLFLKCRHLSINGASNVARSIFYTLPQI